METKLSHGGDDGEEEAKFPGIRKIGHAPQNNISGVRLNTKELKNFPSNGE
jgi:hypothetical protein